MTKKTRPMVKCPECAGSGSRIVRGHKYPCIDCGGIGWTRVPHRQRSQAGHLTDGNLPLVKK